MALRAETPRKVPSISDADQDDTAAGQCYRSPAASVIRTDVILRDEAAKIIAIYLRRLVSGADMAVEIYVLSDRRLKSLTEWQRAIDAESFPFPLRLAADASFDDLNGFLPARYENAPSGFECDHWDSRSIIADYPHIGFGHAWKYALAFRFGVKPGELESAWMAATAYARATRGLVFDTEEGK